jgi:5-methylcytosine-specific restriction endonuclease McrA
MYRCSFKLWINAGINKIFINEGIVVVCADTLILNANWSPLSWLPLSIIGWQQAIKLQVMNRIVIIEHYDDWEVHSPSVTMKVPALAITKDYHSFQKGVQFSRQNLYLRDLFQCQYCCETLEPNQLNIDHVIPLSKGGKTNWENCVTSCIPCNSRKGSKTIKPIREPFKPDYWTLSTRKKKMTHQIKHPSWEPFIS